MARSISKKEGLEALVANGPKPNDELYVAAIIPIKPDGTKDTSAVTIDKGMFYLNPSSWEEDKTSNWIQHNIPGSSDPILQWVSGGARTLTFEALVTKDQYHEPHLSPVSPGPLGALADAALSVVGSIASAFAGVNLPPIPDIVGLVTGGTNQTAGNQLSIADKLNFYRSLAYPTYTAQGKLQSSPPLVFIAAGETFTKRPLGNRISFNDTLWVVYSTKISITKQLPNLSPLEATVTFTLLEYALKPKDRARISSGGI